jgi:hypothetical protein
MKLFALEDLGSHDSVHAPITESPALAIWNNFGQVRPCNMARACAMPTLIQRIVTNKLSTFNIPLIQHFTVALSVCSF